MKELIVSEHAVDSARKKIPELRRFSKKEVERWYMKNVFLARKIPFGSNLYLKLEKGKEGPDRQFEYFKDNYGIYVVEIIDNERGFLRTFRKFESFGETPKPKLVEFIKEEKLAKLIELRDYLPQREIPDIVA